MKQDVRNVELTYKWCCRRKFSINKTVSELRHRGFNEKVDTGRLINFLTKYQVDKI